MSQKSTQSNYEDTALAARAMNTVFSDILVIVFGIIGSTFLVDISIWSYYQTVEYVSKIIGNQVVSTILFGDVELPYLYGAIIQYGQQIFLFGSVAYNVQRVRLEVALRNAHSDDGKMNLSRELASATLTYYVWTVAFWLTMAIDVFTNIGNYVTADSTVSIVGFVSFVMWVLGVLLVAIPALFEEALPFFLSAVGTSLNNIFERVGFKRIKIIDVSVQKLDGYGAYSSRKKRSWSLPNLFNKQDKKTRSSVFNEGYTDDMSFANTSLQPSERARLRRDGKVPINVMGRRI